MGREEGVGVKMWTRKYCCWSIAIPWREAMEVNSNVECTYDHRLSMHARISTQQSATFVLQDFVSRRLRVGNSAVPHIASRNTSMGR